MPVVTSAERRHPRSTGLARLLLAAALVGSTVIVVLSGANQEPATVLGERTQLRLAAHQAVASVGDPVVAAAGDIACDPLRSGFNNGQGTSNSCQQMKTSDLLVNAGLAAVMPLGDNQYYCGGYGAWLGSYEPSWGRVKNITFPAVGNHEYIVDPASDRTDCDSSNEGAAGYYRYFGAAAGDPSRGYYSYDVGTWHVIVLNSNCSRAGGCSASSAQGQWLRADLAAHQNFCTMAYWHVPLFSSGGRASTTYRTFWDALYAADAEVVLAGHDHTYERFAPQRPDGTRDDAQGIRQFVVGTGGSNYTSFVSTEPNSQARNDRTFGVLKLTLHPQSYDWRYESVAGQTYTDSGSDTCHGTSSDQQPPSAPGSLSATATSPTSVSLSWSESTDDVGVIGYRIYRDGTQVGTSTSTGFTDDTAAAGTAYAYTVRAYDAGGNLSGDSNTATVTTPATPPPGGGGTTLTLTPSADTYVRADQTTASLGSTTQLAVDGSPQKQALLRFDVPDLAGATVTGARLRLFNTDASPSGGTVRTTTGSWSESTTWSTRPAAGPSVGSLGVVSPGAYYDANLGVLPSSGQPFNLLVDSTNGNGADYASSEAVAGQLPQLVLTLTGSGSGGGGDTEDPSTPSGLSANATSSTSVALSWTGSTDNVAVTEYAVRRDGTEIATSPSTSFTDTTAAAGTSYTYTVRARDAAGNESADSNTATVTTPTSGGGGGGTTLTFTPSADTFVRADQTGTSSGSAARLEVDGSPQKWTLLEFDVTGVGARTVNSATLRLHNVDAATNGGIVHTTGDTWDESTTWTTRPALGATIGSVGAVSANNWYTVQLSAKPSGDGRWNLAIDSPSTNGADYISSEGAAGFAPQLILDVS